MWASYLSALLKGCALEVFVRLSRDDQSDYGQIKEALLTNFDLTERSFRKKFRDCRRATLINGWVWLRSKRPTRRFVIFGPRPVP